MMSDLEIKRVVVACDAECEISATVREAAALATKWAVPLHGVFVESENLLRLAGLPFSRQVSLSSPNLWESFASNDIETLFSAIAAGMRRTLAAAAESAGLHWSFTVANEFPGADAVAAGDILIVDACVRPFSGSWRPRSRWESVAESFGTIVLLRRDENARPGRVVIVLGADKAAHARTFAAVRSLTSAKRIAVIEVGLSRAETAADGNAAQSLASADFGAALIEHVFDDAAGIGRRLVALNPAFVAIETAALESERVNEIIASTRCNVLLIG